MGRGKRNEDRLLALSDGDRSRHQPPPRATQLLTVQMNGKVKTRFQAPVGLADEEIVTRALAALETYGQPLQQKDVRRAIVVDRLVNLVT